MIVFLFEKGTMVFQATRTVVRMDLQGVMIVTLVIFIHIVTVRRCDNARRTSNIIDCGSVDSTVLLGWGIRSCVRDSIFRDGIDNMFRYMDTCGISSVEDDPMCIVIIGLDFAESSAVSDAALSGQWICILLYVCIVRMYHWVGLFALACCGSSRVLGV